MCTPVCRVCLAGGLRMRAVDDSQLLETYERLAGTKLNAGDGRPNMLCYICSSQLQRCWRFSDMAHRSEKFMKDLLQNNIKVSHETVASLKMGITQSVSFATLSSVSFDGFSRDGSPEMMYEIAVKQEIIRGDTPKLENSSSTEDFDLHDNIKTENNMNSTELRLYCCHVCQKTSMTKIELVSHLKTHSTADEVPAETYNTKCERTQVEQGAPHCKECNKTISGLNALKQYASVHADAKPFVCDLCSLAFRLKQCLQNHISVHHSAEKRFVCDMCSKSFFHKKGLIAHKKSPKCNCPTYKPYTCKTCESTFADVVSLRQHARTHLGERRFACSRCDKAFTVKSYLAKHVKQVHSAVTPFPCHRCTKKFKHLSTLKIHMRLHTKEKLFACLTCGETFMYKSSLKSHTSRHTTENEQTELIARKDEWPYCCDRCSKKFRSQFYLKVHLRTHTGEQPFCCDKCGKKFNYKGSLRLHMKIHEEKGFACEICGKTFVHKCNLKTHYQVHSDVRPYACNGCEMTFTFKSALKEHVRRLHSEVKAFACSKCGKSFDQESGLASHARRHTAERAHSCQQCRRSYTRAEHLKRHMAIHSEEAPHACDQCGKTFKIMKYLKQHAGRCRKRAAGPV